jgi:hypothetical protein
VKESTIVSKIMREVRNKYPRAIVWKLADRFTRGLPDLLIFFQRLVLDSLTNKSVLPRDYACQVGVLAVEVKAPNGKLKSVQGKMIFDVRQLTTSYGGCWAILAGSLKQDPVEQTLKAMKDLGAVR